MNLGNRHRPLVVQLFLWLIYSHQAVWGQGWRELIEKADSAFAHRQVDMAVQFGREAHDLARKEYSASDTTMAMLYERLGRYSLTRGGLFKEAAELFERALKIREAEVGMHDSSLVNILLPLGASYFQNAEYTTAEKIFNRLIGLSEESFGPNSIKTQRGLDILGSLYSVTGRSKEAEVINRKNLAIRLTMFGPDRAEVAVSLQNLSTICLEQGKFLDAESLSVRALSIFRRAYGSESIQVAGPLNNMGQIYYEEGRKLDAKRTFLNALRLKETSAGMTSTSLISTLNNLGVVYGDLGFPDSASMFFKRALSVFQKNYGGDHPSSISTLQKMGQLLYTQNKYAEAESTITRSIAIAVKAWGAGHPAIARSSLLLANIVRDRGAIADAESLYLQALQIRRDLFGPDNIQLCEGFEGLSNCYRLQNKHDKSFEMALEAFRIATMDFGTRTSILSERDALVLASQLQKYADNLLSLSTDRPAAQEEEALRVAQVILTTKAKTADASAERNKVMVLEKDSSVVVLAEQYRATLLFLSKQYVAKPTVGFALFKSVVDSLTNFCNNIEAQLARKSLSFRTHRENQTVTVNRIASLLPPNSTLVEYLKYNFVPLKTGSSVPHYIVLALTNTGQSVMKVLGHADTIDALIDQYRQHLLKLANLRRPITRSDQQKYDSICSRLYKLVWEPIAHSITEGNTLFVAPDGGINLISFVGLMDGKGKYLIEKHPIHYLSAGRDLIRISQDSTAAGTGMLAFGDPDYDATVALRASGAKEFAANIPKEPEVYTVRNVRSGCGTLSEMTVDPLPQTRPEVESAARSWKNENDTEDAFVCLGAKASEEEFKHATRGKRVIHLATHGYFLEDDCGRNDVKTGRRTNSTENYGGENPLLLSGLFLAGSNLHGNDADSVEAEDGIVTALEVSGMDLRGTDLVVLSACETGLGKVEQGEGVYGLRRAFQMAGAKTVVSSLWQVPDDETMKFMQILYSTKAKTYPELMQQVALQRIKEARLRGRPTHPFSWGAFVATGEWRVRK